MVVVLMNLLNGLAVRFTFLFDWSKMICVPSCVSIFVCPLWIGWQFVCPLVCPLCVLFGSVGNLCVLFVSLLCESFVCPLWIGTYCVCPLCRFYINHNAGV